MLDVIKVCRSCGITPVFDNTPGEEEYCILMFALFCEDSPKHKIIFRKLAEDVDYDARNYFSNWYAEELPIIGKPDGLYEFLRIPYKNAESLWQDLEHVAIQIVAQSEPELELDILASFLLDKNSGLSGNQAEPDYPETVVNFKKKYSKYPFIIHAAVEKKNAFPTHTHGLNEIGLPEFIINAHCYGSEGNKMVINAAYKYFNKPKRRKQLNQILHGKTLEVQINKLCKDRDWRGLNYPICFRLVQTTFEAVKMAYDQEGNGVEPGLAVIQIYVKGDDFALTDEYYKESVSW